MKDNKDIPLISSRKFPSVGITGIEGCSMRGMHFDVSGNWGGKRAIVVHFSRDDNLEHDDGMKEDYLYLYILVGPYWKVGKWSNDDPPSMWEIAKLVIAAMEKGADRRALYNAICQVIDGDLDGKAPER